MNLVEALAFGVKGNLAIPRDQEFAHAALRMYGALLAETMPPTIDPMQFPVRPKLAQPRKVPQPQEAAPKPAPQRATESYSPGKRDLYDMLRKAVENTAKDDDDAGR